MRRHRLTEMLLAERESRKREKEIKQTWNRKNINAGLHERNGKLDEAENSDLKFPHRLMYKKEIARECGVPRKIVYDLIEDGKLQKIKFPGCRDSKYSPKQLEKLIKNYNKLF